MERSATRFEGPPVKRAEVIQITQSRLGSAPAATARSFDGEDVARMDMNVGKAGQMFDLTA